MISSKVCNWVHGWLFNYSNLWYNNNVYCGLFPLILVVFLHEITVYPVITAFHSCCLSHHVFDQVNLWPTWVGFETTIFWQCSPGTEETQRLYPLRHGPRRDTVTRLIIPIRGRGKITWRRPELKFGRNVVKEETTQKNYQDEDEKSAINKN